MKTKKLSLTERIKVLEKKVKILRNALLMMKLGHTRTCSYDQEYGDEGEFCTCNLIERNQAWNKAIRATNEEA